MNKNQFLDAISLNFAKGKQLILDKNADYSKDSDPLANFRSTEIIGVPMARAILVRMMDKVCRISNLLDKDADAKVKDEKIGDTLLDLMNYSNILKVAIENENNETITPNNNKSSNRA